MFESPVLTQPGAASGRPRVTFYVQHLLGIGHLARAFRIVKALAEDAFTVHVVVGGILPSEVDAGLASIVQLPPIRAGEGGFSALVHPDGATFDATAENTRRDLLLAHFDRNEPDILMIEAFPFGRRQMRFELIPLLERARARHHPPLIVSSVRDILQEDRRPERITETLDVLDRYFDLVLVHGDPTLVLLEQSFPAARRFGSKIAYTGLVAPPIPTKNEERHAAVVSVGGGAVGETLLRAAMAAKPLTPLGREPWLFLTGPNLPAETRGRLERDVDDTSVLASFVPDLAQVLRNSTLSVSQAGYNTVADILAAGCRSVLIPYVGEGETEQTRRASVLQERNRVVMVEEHGLQPAILARAISRALGQSWIPGGINLQGAPNTARALLAALNDRHMIRGPGQEVARLDGPLLPDKDRFAAIHPMPTRTS